MTVSQAHVGFLLADAPSAEQRAARGWCASVASRVGSVSLSDLADGAVDPDQFDVLWWHRAAPLPELPPAAASALSAYAEGGGGLLLSLRALSAVEALGVDPVPPDACGTDPGDEPAGFLVKVVYGDHPAFDGLEGLRVYTAGGGPRAFARYERVLPARGDVLASAVRGGEDVPREVTLLTWDHGDGTVIGAGAAVPFADPVDEAAAARRERLVDNLLGALAHGRDEHTHLARGRPKRASELAALRERLADDPHRPRYHLSPPADWLNDPNGLVRWDGRYHVFYQYNPGGPMHDTIHWGHAVSDDLVTWEDRPVALSPSPDGPDRDGCWSGCAVDDDGDATVLYTGGRGRVQLPCLAVAADDSLDAWEKDPANPIIEAPPPDLDVHGDEHWDAEFRDHCVWREGSAEATGAGDGGRWYQVIGSGVADVGGAALLYESADLRDWEYVGPLLVGDWPGAGEVWECPEVLDLGEKHLLHVSNYESVEYFVGELDAATATFEPERGGRLDHGDFYAPQTMRDGDRTLTWGWLWPARDGPAQWDAGWSGMLSLPRVLDLGDDGRLRQRPAREVERLRTDALCDHSLELEEERLPLEIRGTSLEVALDLRFEGAEEFGLVVRESPGGEERTPIRCRPDGAVVVDRSHASADPACADDERRMPPVDERAGVRRDPGADGTDESPDRTTLRVFLDGSSIEIFRNERRCLTARHYPLRADSDGLSVYATGGAVAVERLAAWEMGSAWD